jgi:hypothetical protein
VPPALISGKLVSDLINKQFYKNNMKQLFDDVFLSKLVTKTIVLISLAVYMLSQVRDAIYSIYGFVRFADEIVDSFHGFDKEVLMMILKRIL